MDWLKSHWRWGTLNLLAVFTLVFVLAQGSTDWDKKETFDPGLESGKWAIRFLLACLSMTPLNTYFGWSSAIKLRKSAGLWAFGFACLHVLFYVREAKLGWLTLTMPSYLALGLTGLVILSTLAITSNRWAMRQLGKAWKRLHRLVYLAGIVVVTHSLLALTMSKNSRNKEKTWSVRFISIFLFDVSRRDIQPGFAAMQRDSSMEMFLSASLFSENHSFLLRIAHHLCSRLAG